MSPPELTGYTPVFDVGHPVAVGVLEFYGDELDVVFHDGGKSRFYNLLHLHEPLHREFRLYNSVCTL